MPGQPVLALASYHGAAAELSGTLVLGRLGGLRAALGDYAEAEDAYDHAIAANNETLSLAPDWFEVYIRQGYAAARLGELRAARVDFAGAEVVYTEAIAATDEALRRAPDHVVALGNQGEILRKFAELDRQHGDGPGACTRLQEARTLLDRALTLAPNHREIAAERARVADLPRSLCPDPA